MKTIGSQATLWLLLTLITNVVSQDRTKSNILDSKPIRVQDYGTPPVTSTIPLYDCTSSHRPKADIPSAFEVYHNKAWYLQSCEEGLTWNQTMCRCEFPNGRRPVVRCRDYRATSTELTGTYEQLVNGQWIVRDCSLAVAGLVWDQEACQCVWGPNSKEMVTGQGIAPCEVMLNMTFENGVKDEAKGSFIEVGRGNPVPIFSVNKRDTADGYKAAYFSDTALNIWYFAGNELGTSLRVEFRFKMTNDPVQRDKYQIFISNGCNVSAPGYTTPSLAIGYRAADQSYLLAFETATARKAIVCTRKLGAYDWHTLSLIYEDGTLLFRVDDNPCIISQDFSGPIQKTPCPLTIGADPLERESMYKGYLDNLLIARYCRRFIDTDPNDAKDKLKGPMIVEAAPILNDIEVQPRSGKDNLAGKSGRNQQRGVTSSKYFPKFPSILNTGSVYSEKLTQDSAYKDSIINSETSRDDTSSYRKSVKPDSDKNDLGQSGNSEKGYRGVYSRYERTDYQGHDVDDSGKTHEQVNDYAESGQTGESDYVYDDSKITYGQIGGQGTSGQNNGQGNDFSMTEKSGESENNYRFSGKKDSQPNGYGRHDNGDQLTNTYRTSGTIRGQVSGYEGTDKISRQANDDHDTQSGKTGRQVNEYSNLRNNGGFDSSFQNSGQRRGKANGFIDSAKDDNYDKSIQQNRGQDSIVETDKHSNYNSRNTRGHEKTEDNENSYTTQEKKNRQGNKYGSSEIVRVQKGDNVNREDDYRNNFEDQGRSTGQANNYDNSKKYGGSDSDFEKSDENFDVNDNSKEDHRYKNERDTVDKSLEYSDKDETAVGNDKHSVKNWENNNRWTGERGGYIKNNNGIPVGYDEPSKRRQIVKAKTIQRDDHDKDRQGDDNFNLDKEDGERSENDETFGNTGQIKGNKNLRKTKEYENTGQVKRYENRLNREHENTRDTRRFENGQKKENKNTRQTHRYQNKGQTQVYQNTEQAKQTDNGQAYKGHTQTYQNTEKTKQNENGQAYKGHTQNRRASHSNIQGTRTGTKMENSDENFQVAKNVDFDSESSRDVDNGRKTRKAASDSEVEQVTLEVSSYQNMIGSSSQTGSKKTNSLVQEENKTAGQTSVKSGSVNYGKGDSETPDTDFAQENTSGLMLASTESTPNLVKGKRRSGSKKKNWYDKTDTNQSSHEESNSDKQKVEDKSLVKSSVSQTTVENSNKKVIISGTSNTVDARPGTDDPTAQNTQGSDKTKIQRPNQNPSVYRFYQNDHRQGNSGKGQVKSSSDSSVSKQSNGGLVKSSSDSSVFKQSNGGLVKSSSDSSVSKQSNGGSVKSSSDSSVSKQSDSSKDDYDADGDDESEDDKPSQPSAPSGEITTTRSKDRAPTDSKNVQSNIMGVRRSETGQNTMSDAQKNHLDNTKSEVHTTGQGAGTEQKSPTTSLSSNGNESDKPLVDKGAKRDLDMPVDVTKIRSVRSADVTHGFLSHKTQAVPSSMVESDRSILSENDKRGSH